MDVLFKPDVAAALQILKVNFISLRAMRAAPLEWTLQPPISRTQHTHAVHIRTLVSMTAR
jgi:hypothetical protein